MAAKWGRDALLRGPRPSVRGPEAPRTAGRGSTGRSVDRGGGRAANTQPAKEALAANHVRGATRPAARDETGDDSAHRLSAVRAIGIDGEGHAGPSDGVTSREAGQRVEEQNQPSASLAAAAKTSGSEAAKKKWGRDALLRGARPAIRGGDMPRKERTQQQQPTQLLPVSATLASSGGMSQGESESEDEDYFCDGCAARSDACAVTPIVGVRYTQYDAEYDLCAECYLRLDPIQRLEYYNAADGPDAAAFSTGARKDDRDAGQDALDEKIAQLETTLQRAAQGDSDEDTESSSDDDDDDGDGDDGSLVSTLMTGEHVIQSLPVNYLPEAYGRASQRHSDPAKLKEQQKRKKKKAKGGAELLPETAAQVCLPLPHYALLWMDICDWLAADGGSESSSASSGRRGVVPESGQALNVPTAAAAAIPANISLCIILTILL